MVIAVSDEPNLAALIGRIHPVAVCAFAGSGDGRGRRVVTDRRIEVTKKELPRQPGGWRGVLSPRVGRLLHLAMPDQRITRELFRDVTIGDNSPSRDTH